MPLVEYLIIMRNLLIGLLALIPATVFSQLHKMQPLENLVHTADPGWDYVKQWIGAAANKVEVLPCDTLKAKDALYKAQVSTRSAIGAVIYHTGGLLVDHGWIRILGSGSPQLNRSLPDWNKGKTFSQFGEIPSYLLVADDAVGGFFAINNGGLGSEAGMIYYFAPDSLQWQNLNMTYPEFLNFCFSGRLDRFYKKLRWKDWQQETAQLNGNETYNFYPFLWTKEGKDINTVSRKAISVEEQYQVSMGMHRQQQPH